MLKISLVEEAWEVSRDDEVLDFDVHRDLAFLSACNLAVVDELITVMDERGNIDFTFEVEE